MKRLVTLILVLGLATIANAHLQLTLNNSTAISALYWVDYGSVQIGIYKDDTTAEGAFIDYELGADIGWKYHLSSVAVTSNAGDLAGVIDMGIWGTAQEYYVTIANSMGFYNPPGQVFNSTVSGMIPGYSVTINLWNGAGDTIIDTAIVAHTLPEPTTLLLLGLGGLMLRKKK